VSSARMSERRVVIVAMALIAMRSAAASAQTTAAQTLPPLTAVQEVFVHHRALTLLDDVAETPATTPSFLPSPASPQTSAVPTKPAAAGFKPAPRSKVLFYGFELMFYEQVMRVATQQDSRSELKGPFFQDWFDSVHIPRKWGDEDPWQVNYIGHAIHGSAAARIWLDQRERPVTKTQYLQSMGRALVFATIFSELFENGPISEASIGNVARLPERTGWVDHVWTPVGGVLWAMAEDAIDKYVLTRIDQHVPMLLPRVAARLILNPGRMLANMSQNRAPWYRGDRPLTFGLTLRR
jgi:hypothetical protein